jgi:hypothetical protein
MGKGKATAGCVQGSGSCADCPFSYNNLSSHLCAGTPPGEGGHAGVTIALRSGQQVPQFLFWFLVHKLQRRIQSTTTGN